MARRNLIAELMAERVSYGGCVATRYEVYRDCIDRGISERSADLSALIPKTITDEEAARLPFQSLAALRAYEEKHA